MLPSQGTVLQKIKSVYILKKIFILLRKKGKLEIAKYNKKLQKKLNININDYKNCSREIEIEIIPSRDIYGLFFNIGEENKKYCHIYFNDNYKKIERNNLDKSDRVKK